VRGQGRSPTVGQHARDWEHTFTRNRGWVGGSGGYSPRRLEISESTVFPVHEAIRSFSFECFLIDWKVLCHHCYHISGWIFIIKLVQDEKTLRRISSGIAAVSCCNAASFVSPEHVRNSPLQFFIFVVRSRHSRVWRDFTVLQSVWRDFTVLQSTRSTDSARIGLRDSTRLEHESIDSIDRIDRFRGLLYTSLPFSPSPIVYRLWRGARCVTWHIRVRKIELCNVSLRRYCGREGHVRLMQPEVQTTARTYVSPYSG